MNLGESRREGQNDLKEDDFREEESEIELLIDASSSSGVSTDSEYDDLNSDQEEEEENYDLATSIISEIRKGTYVCLICTCEMESDDSFWSCSECYRVYHLSCIESWSKKGSSTDDKGNWKCPACNATHTKQKFQNRCWCKKVINPTFNPLYPGSCGNTCGTHLKSCIHHCSLPCHPGPHASCNALGPVTKCHCGKHDQQWPCVITPYVSGWKCDDICEELLPCEHHKCGKICHRGLCGKCETFVDAVCYCGRTHDKVKCHLRRPKKSFGKIKSQNWIGQFACNLINSVKYDCMIHEELSACAPFSRTPKHCPFSPDVVKSCPCGQTTIEELNNGENRKRCTDSIPTCSKICNKKLKCGHRCKYTCHEGDCGTCFEFVDSLCRCGFQSFLVPCKFIQDKNSPICTRKCTSLLSCRRHRCSQRCCPDEQAALVRERQRKKGLRNNTINQQSLRGSEAFLAEASHICLQICNKKLSCGNPQHVCKLTCHTGPCPPCLESSNEDLVCNCGKTTVPAPVRCGVRLPPCPHQCVRSLSCNHEQMPHNCHPDDIACPKCTKSILKTCNCGKNEVKAMCFQTDVFCLDQCGKLLPCQHHCRKICHREGGCGCTSICGKKKKYCNHVDRSPCHYPSRCNDSGSCNEMVVVTCRCGRLQQKQPCGANSSKSPSGDSVLDCEVSCVLKERDEQLAKAFGKSTIADDKIIPLADIPYNSDVLNVYKRQQKWCSSIEQTLKTFIKSENKTYSFKPMRREQRQFIHELSESYKLFSESQDPEPQRNVYLVRQSNSAIPSYSLWESLRSFEKHHIARTEKAPLAQEINKSALFADYNAMIIEECITGVTRLDLEEAVLSFFSIHSSYLKGIRIEWVQNDTYLIVPEAYMRLSKQVENEMVKVLGTLKALLAMKFLANSIKLAKIDENCNIVSLKSDGVSEEASTV